MRDGSGIKKKDLHSHPTALYSFNASRLLNKLKIECANSGFHSCLHGFLVVVGKRWEIMLAMCAQSSSSNALFSLVTKSGWISK